MDREQDPVFDARGLLRYEARMRADIRVTTLPDGLDPDEVVNRDPEEWQRIVEDARPVVVHVMETLAGGRDLEDPKVKSEIAAQVLPLIEDVPNSIERETYRQRLARLLRVDERALLESTPVRGRSWSRRKPARKAESSSLGGATPEGYVPQLVTSSYALEMHCLGVLLRQPDLLYRVDRELQAQGLPRLSTDDFKHAGHQSIMRLFQESVDQDMAEPLNFVLNSLDLSMMELADGLLERTAELDPNEDRVLEDLMRGLLVLRQRNLHQEIEYRRYLMEEAQEKGDTKVPQYIQSMVQLTDTKRRLDQAISKYVGHSKSIK
jgi:DNA primase